MASSFLSPALVLLFILLSFSANKTLSTTMLASKTNTEYIKIACDATMYPKLCYHSLTIYANKIKTNPKELATTALNITLKATKSTSRMMIKMSKIPGLMPKEAVEAMTDCIEVINDSVDELQQSIEEMGDIKSSNFGVIMSDIQTWVSVALTDEDTCMDGLKGKPMNTNVKTMLRRHVVKVSHLTSNALALVNTYASTNPASP
ncbi:pectinesterase inhibitor 10-like [Pistacia vera]|uniref:pectinesterase inhibitor 10-like n=1 Tax=Pistacia vera TaxID=55513 RepID=UPI0012633E08|nr:pectinesterase inhibitor 10-like [Pistacia vera]